MLVPYFKVSLLRCLFIVCVLLSWVMYIYIYIYIYIYRVLLPLLRMPREGASPTRICPYEPNEPKKKYLYIYIYIYIYVYNVYVCVHIYIYIYI